MTSFLFITTTREPLSDPSRTGRLLSSISRALRLSQGGHRVTVIVVDQGHDSPALPSIHRNLDVKIISAPLLSLSAARNLALKSISDLGYEYPGDFDVVGFPDDDCAYDVGMLDALSSAAEAGGICIFTHGSESDPTPNRALFAHKSLPNVIRLVSSNVMFFSSHELGTGDRFDEDLGLGSIQGSAEDIDFVTRIWLKRRAPIVHSLYRVFHPRKPGRQGRYYKGNMAYYRHYSRVIAPLKRLLLRHYAVGIALLLLRQIAPSTLVQAWFQEPRRR